METFSCSRCGYVSKRKADFLRHLRRKYPCRPKLQDVPVEDILHKHLNYKIRIESPAWMEFIKKLTPIDPKRPILTPINPPPQLIGGPSPPPSAIRSAIYLLTRRR